MCQGIDQKEAVRLAKEKLGDTIAQDIADYIKEVFGLTMLPTIVTVLLGTIQERAILDRTRQAAHEKIEQWKVENPQEAKKLAAAAKRREAAKLKKAGLIAPFEPTPAVVMTATPEDATLSGVSNAGDSIIPALVGMTPSE